jgi:uncharacterized protein (TIGR02569 family)
MATNTVIWPSWSVIKAFGLGAEAVIPLTGGQGRSFLVSFKAVLKPLLDASEDEAEWSAGIMSSLCPQQKPNFQVPDPILASNGRYVYEGWTASKYCPGDHKLERKFMELIPASRAFHEALRGFPEPELLSRNTHPWAVADRVAWEGHVGSSELVPALAPIYNELRALRQDVSSSPSQLIHADLSGNVLFSDSNPPVIIDFSPFWRPVEYAEAIAVLDGIMWFGVEKEMIDVVRSGRDWLQMLVKALIFRVVSRSELQIRGMFPKVSKETAEVYRDAMELVKEKIDKDGFVGSGDVI